MSSVVFVSTNDLSKTSGSGIATKELVRAVGEVTSADLCVVCPRPAHDMPDRVCSVVDRFRYLPAETAPGNPLWHAKVETALLVQLVRQVRAERPAAVVTRLAQSTLFPAPLCRLLGIPYILLVRGVINRDDEYGRTKFYRVVEGVVRLNVSLADEVYAAFDSARAAVEQYRSADQSSIEVVPNAVDPELFAPFDRERAQTECDLDLPSDAFVVGFVGTLAARQMLPTLLRAVADVDGVHLLVVGDGPLADRLRTLATDLAIDDRVTFTGRVPYEAVPAYIGACDVTYGVVNPDRPSNPIKCYEYLACERPVVTSRSPELSFVETESAGVVLDDVTPATVANAVRDLRDTPLVERRAMGERGRAHVQEAHTWRAVARRVLPADLQAPADVDESANQDRQT